MANKRAITIRIKKSIILPKSFLSYAGIWIVIGVYGTAIYLSSCTAMTLKKISYPGSKLLTIIVVLLTTVPKTLNTSDLLLAAHTESSLAWEFLLETS